MYDLKTNSQTNEVEIEVYCAQGCGRRIIIQLRKGYTQREYENAVYGWGWMFVNGRPACNECINNRC